MICFNSGHCLKDHFGDVTEMVKFLEILEQVNNPDFKPVEFERFGLNHHRIPGH
jgi:hypothetical protein